MLNTEYLIVSFPFIVCLVAVLAFVLPMKSGVRAKAIWIMVLLACACRGLIYERIGGKAQAPELPAALIVLWDWACSGMYLLAVFALGWWMRKGRQFILPVLAWGIAAIGCWNGLKVPDVHEVELRYPDLPAELDGYRIAQLTDLHCCDSRRGWRTQAIVDRINAAHPRLICLTGDHVDGRVARLGKDMEPLTQLQAPDGVWCVRGNHEDFVDVMSWRHWYDVRGFRFLANECVFPRPSLALGGVNDRGIRRGGGPLPDVATTFQSVPADKFRILLQHRPEFAHANIEGHGVRLMLSGHTHGGLFPGLDLIIKRHNHGYVSGIYPIGRGYLYVSPGCGQWGGFPLRLFHPSEITVIVLRKGNS